MKRTLTATVFAETVGAAHAITEAQVRDPAYRALAEATVRTSIATFAQEHRVAEHGEVHVEWVCRATVTGYRTPDGADPEAFRAAVSQQDQIDHFGKPAAVEFAFEIEVPHRDDH